MARRPANPVRMVPEQATIGGRALQYALSDNEVIPFNGAAPQVWAVNVHGYFAGGRMYWRESARLAGGLDWRVVNPSLPGFGGSAPLDWDDLSMRGFSDTLARLLDHLGVDQAVVLGHSMGGAVAMQFAHDHPDRTLGVVYRDGAGTASWKERRTILARVLSPVSPDLGVMADLVTAVAADVPDLLIGRIRSTLRGVIPDARRNIEGVADALPVAAMLFACDLHAEVERATRHHGVPVLPVWGRYDRITPRHTADEFEAVTGVEVEWVRGGHSWMIARPGTQLAMLRDGERGRAFCHELRGRQRARPGTVRPPVPITTPAPAPDPVPAWPIAAAGN